MLLVYDVTVMYQKHL